MHPEIIRSVEIRGGSKRHIIRDGRRVHSPPSEWPICLCTHLDILPGTVEVHEDVEEIENLCKNCEQRMVDNGS